MNDKLDLSKQELSDDMLDGVVGGANDFICLDEHNLPGGWYVTCIHCTLAFPASERECPSCGGTEVWPGTSRSTVIYKPELWR